MKQVFAYILILAVLSFQLSEMLVYFSFKINQDYIAKNLCVEKDVKGSSCKGCCQLKKKLEDQQQKKEALPTSQVEKLDINFVNHQQGKLVVYQPERKELHFYKGDNYCFQLTQNVFHPPRI